jgi:hypothetical protein
MNAERAGCSMFSKVRQGRATEDDRGNRDLNPEDSTRHGSCRWEPVMLYNGPAIGSRFRPDRKTGDLFTGMVIFVRSLCPDLEPSIHQECAGSAR